MRGDSLLAGDRIDPQLAALRAFAERLAQQTTRPALVAVGVRVATFASEAGALRQAQLMTKAALALARRALETLRLEAAAVLIGMVGTGLQVWSGENARVDRLFSVSLMRGGARSIPDAPADTQWLPAERRLSTTVMPHSATRLEAWRQGPGGMPEMLATGDPDELELTIPASIIFREGEMYQLWLVALNSRGSSGAGPVVTWENEG